MSEPRRSIATVCLSGTVEDKLVAAAAAGFDGVEIFENDLIASAASPAEIGAHCRELGLSVDLYQPFRDFEAVPPARLRENLRRAERKFDVMEQLGTDLVLVCSTVSPEAVDDDELAAEHLRTLAEHAQARGMRVAYEALAWGRFVNTYEHSWRIVRRADHPALGLCLDSFHVLSRDGDPALIRTIPGEKLFYLQLADAPKLDMDVLQWSRHHRLFPGQGSFDLTTFAGNVLEAGYTGPLSLEVFNDVFRQADPKPAAVDAMRSLRLLEEQLGIPVAEPAPELNGYAFAELLADPATATGLADGLAALGFVETGEHRSKAVHRWEQGGARVLINSSASEPDTAEIGALAVESADPLRSARRAEAMSSPILPRERGPQEAGLASVAAPDGTGVFFCDTSAPDGWLSDFRDSATPPEGLITGIDHVSLTQPFDHFDEAALFCRSVLGLEPEEVTEYAAPFGMVRNRGMVDATCSVRIALNGTLVRRGEWAPAVRDPQHIAFTCTDVLAMAERLRASGAPVLPIPDNYYDDLDARFALDPELLASLRRGSVLYDRDAGGEFLHVVTELFGSRVFLELVQRVGDYAGYGVANAPVRMAAHRRQRMAASQPTTPPA
ncbi:sugar phosphate isomerase/epimerase and 4-hydroxyphenylpyruvate domain-containing protein [Saccharopolyspora rhizosphaerae]|uniref:3-dehydroshikimate dehydratase n=1 Tax=Saccharopolyspora rhizosphaerae TaxID=2492662 RepID=A0A426K3K6_9PSEU|nr:sugar phosphate isomerase/epimerase and 4-hydroxyphenylpyruvate domain-containing protein [Saccharopolyspora rhizosphaerae]RRO19954.1 sugar phosphate isomerase/epimerase and 4-hydroxyphenylpyruvate domain-containing protein [Saccharopolyspora rhizosphaerae]